MTTDDESNECDGYAAFATAHVYMLGCVVENLYSYIRVDSVRAATD